MRVYYLLSEKWALESLVRQRVKVSLFSEMNDPFELLGLSFKRKSDRAEIEQVKKEVSEEMGAICFSKVWSNPVLWSHYADRHRGIALGFDVPNKHLKPISYNVERIEQDLIKSLHSDDGEDLSIKLLTIKYEHWRYEDEIRLPVMLKDAVKEKSLYFLPYCDALKLKEVIIGPRSELSIKSIYNHIPKPTTGIKVIKSRLAFQSFKVVKNQRFK